MVKATSRIVMELPTETKRGLPKRLPYSVVKGRRHDPRIHKGYSLHVSVADGRQKERRRARNEPHKAMIRPYRTVQQD